MRRSICYCDPSTALAGEVNTWKFIYTPAASLPKGTKLRFDLDSKGRTIDWELPTCDLKTGSNVIYGLFENGKTLAAKEINVGDDLAPQYEFTLTSQLEAGETFTIIIGAATLTPKTVRQQGNQAQTHAQRRRSFLLHISTAGRGKTVETESFHLDVRGNALCNINVLAPSYVTRNKRFDVVVRFEDEYGNLTSEADPETLIELSHEHLRENLNWKLFVPETGFLSLPNLYFNEPGIYTIKLKNLHTNQCFYSSPIRCFPESNQHLFWGLLHGESDRIDSTENIESCLRHIRDDKALNFFACSPFESQEETPTDIWKNICQHITDFDEADRFATMCGFQWLGEPHTEGLRQIIYLKDQRQILRAKDPKFNSLKKIYRTFQPKEILSIPCFTMGGSTAYNFDDFDPEFERVVEIYNAWGSSECTKKDGNSLPIHTNGKLGVKEAPEGAIQKALQRNCRFGFVAGGLDDRGMYAELYEGDQEQYTPGLTAISAPEHSRAALLEALYNRSCYATTGKRIILALYIASYGMGSETSTAQKHGFLFNRHLHGFVAGTTDLESVEVIRNGKVIKRFEPTGYALDFAFDDLAPIQEVVIDAKDKKPPFVYYYLRVTQKDGHMGWSSPIWVDYVPSSAKGKSIVKLRPAKPVKAAIEIDDTSFEDEEEDEVTEFDDFDVK
jgi:hypothetical protein